jgi:hypothetical protein
MSHINTERVEQWRAALSELSNGSKNKLLILFRRAQTVSARSIRLLEWRSIRRSAPAT